MTIYSDFVSVKRRYTRSVNLERDIKIPDSIQGYIPTPRSIDGLTRFIKSASQTHSVRAWTLTGAYGTGKSAFAHFLTTLCGPEDDKAKQKAIRILLTVDARNKLSKQINKHVPQKGFLRAIVTAQREPIANTIARALYNGATLFWGNALGRKPNVLNELAEINTIAKKGKNVEPTHLLYLLGELNRVSKTGIILIIDELGKNLEHSAQHQAVDDLYLLQQIAELPSEADGNNVFILGLLHQAFVDYAHSLGSEQRKEWSKIQGRFEDIPFIESSNRMIQLIGNAIKRAENPEFKNQATSWTKQWTEALSEFENLNSIDQGNINSVFPIHPLTALALPILCSKYSQNDRTLFTFLSSEEPNSFASFLKSTSFENENLECLKLYHLYDYFIETAGLSFSMRPQLQRWVEIHSRITDAKYLEPELVNILKTIGILNLISTTGYLKASKKTVAHAMCNVPNNQRDLTRWGASIDKIIRKGFLTWRKQIDELRIWEGSDFDIDIEVQNQSQLINIALAQLLNKYFPLKPLIAQRHSYQTGTLRYFERVYHDDITQLEEVECESKDSDGLIIYWLGDNTEFNKIGGVPQTTTDGRPVIVLCAAELKALKNSCHEYTALSRIKTNSKQLQSDGVARREVVQRTLYAERILEESLNRSFDITSNYFKSYRLGVKKKYNSWIAFQNDLSETLDTTYHKGLRLWNELINRRELTSQGAAARHKLITAMLESEGQEKLGIVGAGPEYSMFESMLLNTGMYKEIESGWVFAKPYDEPSILSVWKAIEKYLKSAINKPKSLGQLYEILSKPPYGVKNGPIPVLLLGLLQYYKEYISIYQDGNFVPVLGAEHFELYYKKPERFSAKFFNITGLRAQLFQELEGIFIIYKENKITKLRNQTILSVVASIFRFIKRLPDFTIETKEALSDKSVAVRDAILKANEPDVLLFETLPEACGLSNLKIHDCADKKVIKTFRSNLAEALKELQTAYEKLLTDCKLLIYSAFKISSDIHKLREDLRVRSSYLHNRVVEDQLRRFILAAIDETETNANWLENLIMIIADKPPRVWKDKDRIVFESKLHDLARRFNNLEALQKEMSRDSKTGYIARRITVTKPDGKDLSHVAWIDQEQMRRLEKIAQSIYDENEELIDVLAAILVEKAVTNIQKKSNKKNQNEIKVRKSASK